MAWRGRWYTKFSGRSNGIDAVEFVDDMMTAWKGQFEQEWEGKNRDGRYGGYIRNGCINGLEFLRNKRGGRSDSSGFPSG